MSSPTAKTLNLLRKLGYHAEVVEKMIPYSYKRKDFLGFIDIIAIKTGEILGVQTTSGSNKSGHLEKIAGLQTPEMWKLAGGKIALITWSMKGKTGTRKLWEHNWEWL